MSNKILIGVDPVPAPRMTDSDRWKTENNKNQNYRQRTCVTRYFAYKNAIVLFCNKFRYTLEPELNIVFHIPMPDSWSKKKKEEMCGQPHQVRPDIDNLCKGFMDSFGKEDSFVWKISAEKRWALEGKIELM